MVRNVLNRLIGRKDLSIDAVNAVVEGNASADEIQLVESLMQDNPSLEKDISTQQALRSVLGKIEKIEAPRSFAVTPEMVAAAAGQDSLLSRVAELFAPQRKLALAPAVIAVIAAAGVALLTIGDLTGVVDQSNSGRDSSFSAAAISESAAGGGASNPSLAAAPVSPESAGAAGSDDAGADAFIMEKSSSAAATVAPASTSKPAADAGGVPEPEMAAADSAPAEEAPVAELADSSASSEDPEPPSLMMEAPTDTLSADADDSESVAGSYDEDSSVQQIQRDSSEIGTDSGILAGDGSSSIALETELAYAEGATFEPVPSNNGISLPLWQLQAALVALAIAAIGAWAGLRRTRGE